MAPRSGVPAGRRFAAFLSAVVFTWASLVWPARVYAVLPLVGAAGIIVRGAGIARAVLPAASASGVAAPVARQIVGLSPLGWVTVTSLGIQAGRELLKLVPQNAGPDTELHSATVDPIVQTSPLQTIFYANSDSGYSTRFYSSPANWAQISEDALVIHQGVCSGAYMETQPITGYGGTMRTKCGSSTWSWSSRSQGNSCPSGFTIEGGQCVKRSCPVGSYPSSNGCTVSQPQYVSDGIPSIQAQGDGTWSPDPRDPDVMPAEVLSWLNGQTPVVDQYGNLVRFDAKPLPNGSINLSQYVSGMTQSGLPTVTKTEIVINNTGAITSAKTETAYGSIDKDGNVTITGPKLDLPTDYSRENTLAEARDILKQWREDQNAASQTIDQTAQQLKDTHATSPQYKIDDLGFPTQDKFGAWDLNAWTVVVPGAEGCLSYTMSGAVAGRSVTLNPCPWLPEFKPYLNYSVIALAALSALFYILGRRPDALH